MHEPRPRTPWQADAVSGAVAAGMALAVGHLVSGFDDAGTSLVSAVGDEFIDRFAGSLKDLAVELFGTNDKLALVAGIVVVSLGIGAATGVAARARPWIGPVVFGGFAAVGGAAYAAVPLAAGAIGVVAAALAALAGWGTLALLGRLAPVQAGAAAPPRPATMGGGDRRAFLVATGSLAAGAAAFAAGGRRLRAADPAAAFRAATALPAPDDVVALPPSPAPAEVAGLSPYVTPTPDFFRIDTALVVPRVDPGSWRLRIDGFVDRPFELTLDELFALDSVESAMTIACVSNEVGGDLVGTSVWQGVPLVELLDRAGVQPAGEQVLGRSVDGFTAGFPTALALDGRTALVAYGMNGELLPARHGFPARLVVAGLYGYVSATKWLERIELTSIDVDGYWIPRGWSKFAPVKLASRIDVPRSGAELAPGPAAVAGVAWAPGIGVAAVEVQVDDGPWLPCELGDTASDDTWVQWLLRWDADPGDHVLRVRATDATGQVQTADVSDPPPDGATGHHTRRVRVA